MILFLCSKSLFKLFLGSPVEHVRYGLCINLIVSSLEIDVVPGVSVALLGTPDGVDLLVVVSPVVVSGGGPVVAVGETVSVSVPGPVARAAPVPVPGPVVPVAGAGQLVPGPGPGRLPGGLPHHGPLESRGPRPPAVIHQRLAGSSEV